MAHYYGLPADAVGTSTNAKTLDEQAGFEKAVAGLLPALAGAEIVSAGGAMETLNVACREQLVIDDEFFGVILRACKGFTVDLESLAVEVISKVGPGGHFLGDEHTLKHFKREHHLLDLFDTKDRAAWERAGSKDLRQKATERVNKILKEHQPTQLDTDTKKELEDIVGEATKRNVG
jgi:trimethylamine--corrinoid protein Co-methyltransferase